MAVEDHGPVMIDVLGVWFSQPMMSGWDNQAHQNAWIMARQALVERNVVDNGHRDVDAVPEEVMKPIAEY